MMIGINAISFVPGRIGGMETYIRNLVQGLQGQDAGNKYLLLCDRRSAHHLPLSSPSFSRELFDYAPYSFRWLMRGVCRNIFDMDILKSRVRRLPVDLLHHPFTVITPPGLTIPSVLTFHDMQHEYYPEFYPAWELKKKQRTYRRSVEQATRIIAISRHVKESLVERYGADAEKIDVIYPGCGAEYRPMENTALLRETVARYSLEKPFIFYPAATWPHKNHMTLLSALRLLRESNAFDGNLVLTGISKQSQHHVISEIEKKDLSDVVKILGYVPSDELPRLYNLARILIFPSLFEGFGLPIVEAMACGCPVICSNVTSIPEVAGDAGVFFDPLSAADMAEKIRLVWQDKSLRDDLGRRGLERAKEFNWKKTVEQTVEVYKKAAV
jgi:glycosyltransferase involved in cell wall biosynthesis